jgi:hypothetical protein
MWTILLLFSHDPKESSLFILHPPLNTSARGNNKIKKKIIKRKK